jgi:hypothetical protein
MSDGDSGGGSIISTDVTKIMNSNPLEHKVTGIFEGNPLEHLIGATVKKFTGVDGVISSFDLNSTIAPKIDSVAGGSIEKIGVKKGGGQSIG